MSLRLSAWPRIWIVTALAVGGATVCASSQANPGQAELRLARYEWLARQSASNVIGGNCAIISHVACHRTRHGRPPTYRCAYRELQTNGAWRRKVGIISPGERGQWRWIAGDLPFCGVIEKPGPA